MLRVCRTCEQEKPIEEFPRLGRDGKGYRNQCKACRAQYEENWRKYRYAEREIQAPEFSWEREREATDKLLDLLKERGHEAVAGDCGSGV